MKVKELFEDSLPLIIKCAPTIGGIIGGPAGIATGYIIPLLANAFKVSPTDLPGLSSAILSDPAAQDKLSMLESLHGPWISTMLNNIANLTSAEISLKLQWSPVATTNQTI